MTNEFSSLTARDLVGPFTKVTQASPDFAPAQAMLALALMNSLPGNSETTAQPIVLAGRAALRRAKAADPTLEEVFAADALWHRGDRYQWDHAFPILKRGLEAHPNSALLLGLKSDKLISIGRMNDAAEAAREAMVSDSLSPRTRVNLIDSLIYANRLEAGRQVLAEAEAIWPNSAVLEDARLRIDLRYGDAHAALDQLKAQRGTLIGPITFDESWEKFLRARSDPSPSNIEAALESFRRRYRRDASDIPAYLQALGMFGRTDEAFRVTANPVTLDSLETSTEILFRPHMRSLMADPRFIRLANGLGLVSYWKRTGAWPDFCADPQLPYDCRKEAARYSD
jgi:tetratricopeptide (TPR) repeat protein